VERNHRDEGDEARDRGASAAVCRDGERAQADRVQELGALRGVMREERVQHKAAEDEQPGGKWRSAPPGEREIEEQRPRGREPV
jgi:hypothetical protein